MKRLKRSVTLYLIISGLIILTISYLAYRTLAHETLLRHYQQQTQASNNSKQVESFIITILNNRAAHLAALAGFTQFNDVAFEQILETDNEIDDIFLLEGNKLLYPDEINPLNKKQQDWISLITPIIHDPSLLYHHAIVDEKTIPQSGWYISNDNERCNLLFWYTRDDKIIGFRTSYVTLMSDVINQLSLNFPPDIFTVKENSRLLYQSKGEIIPNEKLLQASLRLEYPLTNWQIDYYSAQTDSFNLWCWGVIILLLIIILIILIMWRIYREYTSTVRQAQQHVNFVGQVSHELKTPLTNIALYAEILKEEHFEQESQAPHYLSVITSETERLSRLIQNILSLTKAAKVHIKSTEVNSVLEQIYYTFTPAFNTKGMILNLAMDSPITIETDADRLIQIIGNFLSNAEKYASKGQVVDIELTKDTNYAYISVRDYGQGIPHKELKTIFQPFYRIKSAINEGVSGTGIGLTIAQQIALLLHGEILVENCTPGVCFTLKLPLTTIPDINEKNNVYSTQG